MPTPHRIAATLVLGLLAAAAATALAQRAGTQPPAESNRAASETTARIVASAEALMKTLDAAGRTKVQFPFGGPQKARWSNLPVGIFQREGLRIGDLTPTQRAAVMTLLSTALSKEGHQKVVEIMGGDEYLRKNSPARTGGPSFGEDEYYLAFLGTPSTTTPWMLQYGGHHLAINLTMAGAQSTMAPSLPAAQPATYTLESRTIRPLGRETDKASALVNALNEAQRGEAILSSKVSDLVLGAGRDGGTIQPEGIRVSALSTSQQTMLMEIVREWVGIMNDAFAEPRMAEIRAHLPETYFAWSGPTTPAGAGYFRIQGPALVIEYAPQGGPDHIHTIYRDPTNDYGAKFADR
jgi:hypothetical protein